jgi:hypothetical protein
MKLTGLYVIPNFVGKKEITCFYDMREKENCDTK